MQDYQKSKKRQIRGQKKENWGTDGEFKDVKITKAKGGGKSRGRRERG